MTESRTHSRRRFLGGSLVVAGAVATTGVTPESGSAAPIDSSKAGVVEVSQTEMFSHLGLRWHATVDCVVEVRWSTLTGLSEWKQVAENHDFRTPEGMRGALAVLGETTHAQ